MRTWLATLLGVLLVLAAAGTDAQTAVRIRGTITALDGNVLSVKTREGKDVKVELNERIAVATVQAVKLADISESADGKVTPTGRIQVSKDGVRPPM